MKRLLKLLWLASLLSLAACAPITAPLHQASVLETITTFPGPPLSPVYDGNSACPNISGKYTDVKMLLLDQFPLANNRNGISIKETVLKGEPIERARGVGTFYYHNTMGFYKQAVLDVRQKDKTLTVTLMDSKFVPYKEVTLDLDNPAIGCQDGALVIRESRYLGGSEGRMGRASARERRLRKLPDGTLESKNDWREWYYSYYRGLVGFGPDHRPSGNEPRRTQWTSTFPAAK